MTAPIIKFPWHLPLVFETADHKISPPTARLILSPGRFTFWNRNEHEAELNRERQSEWRDRQRDPKRTRSCCTVEYDADTLDEIWPEKKPFGSYYWINVDQLRDDIRPVDVWDKK